MFSPGLGRATFVKRIFVLAVLAFAAASMQAQGTSVSKVAADGDDGGGRSDRFEFKAGTLVLSRSVYAGTASSVTIGQTLPPGCVAQTVTLPLLAGGTTTVKVKCATRQR